MDKRVKIDIVSLDRDGPSPRSARLFGDGDVKPFHTRSNIYCFRDVYNLRLLYRLAHVKEKSANFHDMPLARV